MVYNNDMASTIGARGPILGGLAFGFIIGNFAGSLIDHHIFTGIASFGLGLIGAGLGVWAGVKISQRV
jgi:hypothetical protein